MTSPLWIPWVLALALAMPAIALAGPGSTRSRAATVLLLVPALAMTVVAAQITLDRVRVGQDELTAAVEQAARSVDGSLGPIGADRVASLVEADLRRAVWVERSELVTDDPLAVTYELAVRLEQDAAEPAVCVSVLLEVLTPDAPDIRFATTETAAGPC